MKQIIDLHYNVMPTLLIYSVVIPGDYIHLMRKIYSREDFQCAINAWWAEAEHITIANLKFNWLEDDSISIDVRQKSEEIITSWTFNRASELIERMIEPYIAARCNDVHLLIPRTTIGRMDICDIFDRLSLNATIDSLSLEIAVDVSYYIVRAKVVLSSNNPSTIEVKESY